VVRARPEMVAFYVTERPPRWDKYGHFFAAEGGYVGDISYESFRLLTGTTLKVRDVRRVEVTVGGHRGRQG